MNIVISSGHSLRVRGARGPAPWGLDEVDENRRVTDRVAAILRATQGITVAVFHDNTSTTVAQNLNNIINFHNGRQRDRDVSVHFNAFQVTQGTRGTEVLYRDQRTLAATVSRAMADAGRFTNRGAKHRTNLAFLNRCQRPAILLEVCFVDARGDVNLYHQHFEAICRSIASSISGRTTVTPAPTPTPGARSTIRQGARGEAVSEAQRLLNTRTASAHPRLAVDGIFGPLTDRRTREFQTQKRIGVDGIIGPITWGRLLG